MKNLLLFFLFAFPLSLRAQNAIIKIDVDRPVGQIDPKIYGVFMEPIHFSGGRMGLPDTVSFNTMYGNLYDPSSPLADENGFRKDYIAMAKELQITNMRWPGGNFVMGYNWQDGIGPKDQRPVRINLAWGGTDDNHVGTDEWIALNRSIGSENIICVNLGLATINDACSWVEYCNYPKGTYWSDLRAKYGHPMPYNVAVWGLGNEVDGSPWELGYKNVDDYVKIAREGAKAMRSVDHSIRFVASGSSYYESSGQWVEWNWKVLTGLGDVIDYLSIHRYWDRSPDYHVYMGQTAMDFDEKITTTAALIKAARSMKDIRKPIYIAVDEWGSFGRNFMSVLPIAQCFNSFIRHADVVKMANFTLFTSLLSNDRDKGTFRSPLFYIFRLFSTNCRGHSIDTYVACDTFNTDKYKGIPYLDVTSVYSKETNSLTINVVNRHQDRTITAEIANRTGSFTGHAQTSLVSSPSLEEQFSFDKQEEYKPVTGEAKVRGNKITCSFPPHSFTQIQVAVAR